MLLELIAAPTILLKSKGPKSLAHCLGRYIKENEMICGKGYVFLNAYTMGN